MALVKRFPDFGASIYLTPEGLYGQYCHPLNYETSNYVIYNTSSTFTSSRPDITVFALYIIYSTNRNNLVDLRCHFNISLISGSSRFFRYLTPICNEVATRSHQRHFQSQRQLPLKLN